MAETLFPVLQFFDNDGAVLNAGLVYTYEPGTTTARATYPTYDDAVAGTNAHTNPVVLDSAGRPPSEGIWITSRTKFVIKTAAGGTIKTYDDFGDEVEATTTQPTRNVLHNPSMRLAQGGTSFAGLGASAGYTLDGWTVEANNSPSARYTVSQQSGGGVNGNESWLKALVTTARASPGATEVSAIGQRIEGLFAQALLATTTDKFAGGVVSFDVILHKDAGSAISFPASVAVYLHTIDGTARQYVGNVTVTAADTWQRVSLVIPSDTTATADNDTGHGLSVGVGLYGGASQFATNGSWENRGPNYVTSASVNVADAVNNYIGITRARLEAGAEQTAYESPSFSEDLAACERYYEKTYDHATAPGTATLAGAIMHFPADGAVGTYRKYASFRYRTRKRAAPTVTLYAPGSGTISKVQGFDAVGGSAGDVTGPTVVNSGETGGMVEDASGTNIAGIAFHVVADARL